MAAHALVQARAPHVVVVGLDASGRSDAIEWALTHARREAHWVVHFVFVTTLAWGRPRPTVEQGREITKRILAQASRDPRLGFRVFVQQIWGDDQAAALVRFASRADADLVVVDDSAKRSEFWSRLARDAGCPVVVAREKRHTEPDAD